MLAHGRAGTLDATGANSLVLTNRRASALDAFVALESMFTFIRFVGRGVIRLRPDPTWIATLEPDSLLHCEVVNSRPRLARSTVNPLHFYDQLQTSAFFCLNYF